MLDLPPVQGRSHKTGSLSRPLNFRFVAACGSVRFVAIPALTPSCLRYLPSEG